MVRRALSCRTAVLLGVASILLTAYLALAVDAAHHQLLPGDRSVRSWVQPMRGSTLDGPMEMVSRLGEPLYEAQPPTGYPDRAESWVNTGALLGRMNFALGLAHNRLRGGGEHGQYRHPGEHREIFQPAAFHAIGSAKGQ